MTDWQSLKVPGEAKAEAATVKDDHGETWEDVLRFYAEHRPDGGVGDLRPFGGEVPDVDAGINPDVDVEALANELARRLDYAELANMTAEELEARLR